MRAALNYIRIACIQSIQYRSELLIWIVLTVINTLVLMLAWSGVFGESGTLYDFRLSQIIEYYFIITCIDIVTSTHFETWRVTEVREGRIDTYLTKPVSYPLQILFQDIGGKVFWFSLALPVLTIVYFFLQTLMPSVGIELTLAKFFMVAALLLFGYWFEFCSALLTVFASFWFEGADGLQHFKWIVLSLFSGFMIPLSFMPDWLRRIVEVLPFKYIYAVPAGVLQGTLEITMRDILAMITIALVFGATVLLVWQKARTKYASAGG